MKNPSPEWLEESRRLNDVPDDWTWFPCANPYCRRGGVWIPPNAREECEARGVMFLPVCSAGCAVPAFLTAQARDRD